MQKIIFSFFLIGAVFLGKSQSLEDFAWLEGEWVLTGQAPDKDKTIEGWERESEERLKGVTTVWNGELSKVTETMHLQNEDGEWFYVAHPAQNETPVKFAVTGWGKNFFIAENPNHDFPKKIRYQRTRDALVAEISDADQKILFVFEKKYLEDSID